MEEIQGLSITPSTFIEELYVPMTFTMDRTFGTNVTYVIDFDDGTPAREFYMGEGQNYTLDYQHIFSIQVSNIIGMLTFVFVKKKGF